jgi:hypothetical protein
MKNPLDMKKDFIKELFNSRSQYNNMEQTQIMSSLFDIISSDIYPDPKRFIIEILQNCDDSAFEYTNEMKLRFTFKDNTIFISHNGKPFDKEDIKSLCSSGFSTKKNNLKATGYKGLGFKSVFQHSEKVLICSDGYKFRFEKAFFNKDYSEGDGKMLANEQPSINMPWHIIPIWTEDDELDDFTLTEIKGWNVNFILFFQAKSTFEECKSFIIETEKDLNYFLFLKSKNIELSICEEFTQISSLKKSLIDENIILLKRENVSNYFYNYEGDPVAIKSLGENFINQVNNDKTLPTKLKDAEFKISVNIAVQLNKLNNNNYTIEELPSDKRLIYAFLPTKANYNFPFLINSNFILDASRTQLRENYWNTAIFSHLPNIISKFQKELFAIFGNSFILTFPIDLQISCNEFKSSFMNGLTKVMTIDKNTIAINTKISRQHPEKCFYEDFSLGKYTSLGDYFNSVYNGRPIFLQSYMKTKGITYAEEYHISKTDEELIKKLAIYYEFKINKVGVYDLLEFFDSDFYQSNYSHAIAYNIVCSFKDTPYFSMLKKKKIFVNNCGQFHIPTKLIVLNHNVENEKFKNHNSLLNEDLLSIFRNDNAMCLLNNLGVVTKDINDELLNQITLKNYNKHNSVDIVRAAFMKWKAKDRDVKSLLSGLNFLTEADKFLDSSNILIGSFYTSKDTWDTFYENNISKTYYIEKSNKSDWITFFKELGLVSQNKIELVGFLGYSFQDNPFLSQKFKEKISKKLAKLSRKSRYTPNIVYIIVIPFAEDLYKTNITKFFQIILLTLSLKTT